MPRIRIETMLLNSLAGAYYMVKTRYCTSIASTWVHRIALNITNKKKLQNVLLKKLDSNDFDEQNFVAKFFINIFPSIFDEEKLMMRCTEAISQSIRNGNEFMKDTIKIFIKNRTDDGWINMIIYYLQDLTDEDKPELFTSDGVPFLGKFQPKPNPISDEDIPF